MVGYLNNDNFIGPGALNKIATNNQNQRKETTHGQPLIVNENKIVVEHEQPVKEKNENNKVQPENKNVSTSATPSTRKPFLSNTQAATDTTTNTNTSSGFHVPVIISVTLIIAVIAIFWISKAYKKQ